MGRGKRVAATACTEKTEGSDSAELSTGHCRVCGASGARPHYGSVSCNGCRSFFRRCIWGGKHYKCMKEGNCNVRHGIPRTCRGCRLTRCYGEGMDAMLVEGDRERQTRATALSVVSARELMRQQAMENEELKDEEEAPEVDEELPPIGDLTRRTPSPLHMRLFAHAAVVQHLIDQQHWADQIGASGTGYYGLDGGRRFRTDLSFKAVLSNPGIASVRTPVNWEGRRIIEPSDVPFIITRSIVLCIDWANLLSDFYALSMSDREALLRARITMVALLMHGVNSYMRCGGDVMLQIDGSYYPRSQKVQAQLPFAVNHFVNENVTAAFDDVFAAMREIAIDDGEIAVLRALALFMSTPLMSPEGRKRVDDTRMRYVDGLYAHIRQRRPGLSERKVAMRIAKILLILPLFKKVAYEEDIAIQSLAVCNVMEDLRGLPYELHTPDASAYQ